MEKTIRRLRAKIAALVTVMIGVILASVLIAEYANAYNLQEGLVSASLHGHMSESADERFRMGIPMRGGEDGSRHSSIFMGLLITISKDGTVVAARGDSIEISTQGLSAIVERVFEGETQGTDFDTNLAWLSEESEDCISIAIVDVSSSREAMARQLYAEVTMFLVAIAVVAGMAWLFSASAVQPIAEAWESQQRFVSDASHELKTPLAVIKANMSVMSRQGGMDDEAMRWIASTTDEADRMGALIADMLELARTDETSDLAQGGDRAGMVPIDLSQLVEETTMELDAVAFERGHAIEEDIEEGVMAVGNPEKLGRLLRVLVDNATKYGGDGSPVGVALHTTKRHIRLSVHNDGNPIPKEDLAHVFDRFYRSDKARTADESKSFGLGLPIAKNIAEAHGGRLTVTSDEESGTTFTLTLRRGRQ